jgi:hypothetical protein
LTPNHLRWLGKPFSSKGNKDAESIFEIMKTLILLLILAAGSALAGTKWVTKTTFGAVNEQDEKTLLQLAAEGNKDGILALVKQGKCVRIERGIGGEWADQDVPNGLDLIIIPNDQKNIKNPGNDAKLLWIPRRFLTETFPLPPEGETAKDETPPKETASSKPVPANPGQATPAQAEDENGGPYDRRGNLRNSATTSSGAQPMVQRIVGRLRPGTAVLSNDGFFETTVGARTYDICQVVLQAQDLPAQKAVVLYDKSSFDASDLTVVFQLIGWEQYSMFRLTNNPAFLVR